MITLRYHAEPVSLSDDLALQRVIALGARYYRRLAEIENDQRLAIQEIDRGDPAIVSLEKALLEEQPDRDRIYACLRDRRRALRAIEGHELAVKVRGDQAADSKRAARRASGLAPGSWGTYQLVEEFHDRARQTTRWPDPLRTHVRLDEGAVAVHVQGREVTRDDIFSSRWGFAQIDDRPYGLGRRTRPGYAADGRWHPGYATRSNGDSDYGKSGQRGAARYRELRIRVDSDGRAPVWARMHVILDREIPDGLIKWVRVHRTRIGVRYRWSVQIVIKPAVARSAPTPTAALVAIDLRCGRRVEGGRLLAYAIGSDEVHHELVIEDHRIEERGDRTISRGVVDVGKDKIADLTSIRAHRLNAVIDQLQKCKATLPPDSWLMLELSHVHAWRSWSRVGALAARWRISGVDLEDPIRTYIESELRQDRHLLAWQSHASNKRSCRVRGRVEQWVAALADRYATLAIEDMAITDLVQADDRDDRTARIVAQRVQILAPGVLREYVKRHAASRDRRYVVVPSAGNTATCSTCGGERNEQRCTACGRAITPWHNAAENVLRRASAEVQYGTADPLARRGSAPQRPTRRNRKRGQGGPLAV